MTTSLKPTALTDDVMQWAATPREPSSHKGDFGHVIVIAGSQGMWGAARLAAEAALRSGAGKVSVATHPSHAALVCVGFPEIMSHAITGKAQLLSLVECGTVVAIGPGLAADTWSLEMITSVLTLAIPKVVDAGALNFLAKQPQYREDWILTPHAGEAACMLRISTEEVNKDRTAAAHALQQRYGGIAILKGHDTLIQEAAKPPSVCRLGNPGMATAGMGDVLTGVIAACLAQGCSLDMAAKSGVWIHAKAGDLAAQAGQRGMIASDLIHSLRACMNP